VTYQRDSLGRIIGIETQIAGVPTTLIEVLGYRADNQVTSQRFGNGLTEIRDYDAKGRLTNQSLAQLQSVSYRYDAAGNLLDRIAVVCHGLWDLRPTVIGTGNLLRVIRI
jgi:YD repeat-containing protein